jgi:predicted acetyltransferase
MKYMLVILFLIGCTQKQNSCTIKCFSSAKVIYAATGECEDNLFKESGTGDIIELSGDCVKRYWIKN